MNINLKDILAFNIIIISIGSIRPNLPFSLGGDFLWWGFFAFSTYIFILAKSRICNSYMADSGLTMPVKIILFWYFICILRGVIVAENYWHWKNLIRTSFVLCLPFTVYIFTNVNVVSYITNKWFKWALPIFFLFLPFIFQNDGTGRFLMPVSIFILFYPILSKKWKIIFLFFILVVLFGDIEARSNLIKYTVPLILCFGWIFGIYKRKKFIQILTKLLLITPIILLILGVSGLFNIFKISDYLGEDKIIVKDDGRTANLTADTRTFIYAEVLNSAIKNEYYIWGRSPARGNESKYFGKENKEILGIETEERFINEVAIANIFTWTGLIGVVLYFFVFARAIHLAVKFSTNQYSRILAMYLSFRWCYAWVEDFTNFDLSYIYLWVVIGLCYSNDFRSMSDNEVKQWIGSIFNRKNRLITN